LTSAVAWKVFPLPFLAYREVGDAAQFAFHQGEQFVQAAFLARPPAE
jgi:hypothetical protein